VINANNTEWIADIKVLSFDLDDTLWDCPPAIARAENALFDWFEQHAPKVIAESGRDTVMLRRSEIVDAHPEIAGDMTALRHKIIEVLLVNWR